MATELASRIPIDPRPEFANILRTDEFFAADSGTGPANGLNGRFDRLMQQSGTCLSARVVLRLCLLGAISLGGLAFVVSENLLLTAIGAAVGGASPIYVLMLQRARRQSLLARQLPVLVDDLVRIAGTGRSIPDCLESVAQNTRAPLGDELAIVISRLQMGTSLTQAIGDLSDRTGAARLGLLSAALTLHERAGCELVAALERLGRILDRRPKA
jgi:tight adherence protein B